MFTILGEIGNKIRCLDIRVKQLKSHRMAKPCTAGEGYGFNLTHGHHLFKYQYTASTRKNALYA
jgi:hypothetical protein